MNNRQLAQIGLGLLGVWTLLSAVGLFTQIAGIVGVSGGRVVLAEVIPVSLQLGLSYLLVFHNAKVATALFPDIEAAADQVPSDLARTLVALTGVLLLAQATPGAVNTILNFLTVGDSDPRARGQLIRRFIGSLVPIAAGLFLIVRPERFLDYLQRPSPEPTADPE